MVYYDCNKANNKGDNMDYKKLAIDDCLILDFVSDHCYHLQ